ncbi:unnamed protein product [Chilo suppressalis]|uniref:Uncharacterized protein n=1 Tax=Chilo suppressalis TaxID=168631 RepID=A0ABN8L3Z2_CHISP|nr:unnamed protein product [Chilo suppressalis]
MPHSDFWPFGVAEKPVVCSTVDDGDLNRDSILLQKQLGDMESEVKEIQMELDAIKRDRLDLHQRKINDVNREPDQKPDVVRDNTAFSDDGSTKDHSRSSELSKLREELIRAKNAADQERFQREKYESKLKVLETKLNVICCTDLTTEVKENKKFTEEEVHSLKIQIRDLNEEIEEMRITVMEKTEQLQDYRVKYLQAQQQVEELKRQLDVIEFDNKQVSDQIQIEIQKMKMQFQEKLQELSPLPDLLKGAQIQLQEAKQMQKLAEDSSQQLSNELNRVKEKLVIVVNNLSQEKADKTKLYEENKTLRASVDEKQKEVEALSKDMEENKYNLLRLEEKLMQNDALYKEKKSECMQLLKDMEETKIESSRTLNRFKERAESMRRYLHTQITEMERQMVATRAQCRQCQKERDELRQRILIQLNNLQENFEMSEIRLRTLQNQVLTLKDSYKVLLTDEEPPTSYIDN